MKNQFFLIKFQNIFIKFLNSKTQKLPATDKILIHNFSYWSFCPQATGNLHIFQYCFLSNEIKSRRVKFLKVHYVPRAFFIPLLFLHTLFVLAQTDLMSSLWGKKDSYLVYYWNVCGYLFNCNWTQCIQATF